MTVRGLARLLDLQACLTLVPWPPPFPSSHLYFDSFGLDEGPGKDADPLNGPLGCSTGMSSSKFQLWGSLVPGSVILDCPAGSAPR